jgi:hypothetical protein
VQPVVLDYESFYSDDFTLSKMTTESYIRDKRFEAHGAAIKWSPMHNAKWYPEKELRYVLSEHDWSDTFLIAHHCQFDALILSHHYKVFPKMYGCTLAMGRLLLGNHLSVALASLAKYFELAPKTIDYFSFKGKHWGELTTAQQEALADGCCRDVEIAWELFQRLLRGETGPRRTSQEKRSLYA